MTLKRSMTIRFLWKRSSLGLFDVLLERDAQLVEADPSVLCNNVYILILYRGKSVTRSSSDNKQEAYMTCILIKPTIESRTALKLQL